MKTSKNIFLNAAKNSQSGVKCLSEYVREQRTHYLEQFLPTGLLFIQKDLAMLLGVLQQKRSRGAQSLIRMQVLETTCLGKNEGTAASTETISQFPDT